MVIYVSFDENGDIDGWGTSPANDGAVKIDIEDDHPFLSDLPEKYEYKDVEIILKDSSLEVELLLIKNSKKQELSSKCQEVIENGFYLNKHKYSYAIDNQQNFSDTMRLFENNMIDKIGWNAYVGEEKKRIQLNKEEFTKVYLAGVKHKTDCLTRLNDVLYPLVDAAENKETIARIYWDTGLPAEELSLKEGESINDQIGQLNKKDGDLEQANMMTMMALVQISGQIK